MGSCDAEKLRMGRICSQRKLGRGITKPNPTPVFYFKSVVTNDSKHEEFQLAGCSAPPMISALHSAIHEHERGGGGGGGVGFPFAS